MGSEGSFYWSATGEPFGPTGAWYDGQPDNCDGREHCVHFREDFSWNDLNCDDQFGFICELAPIRKLKEIRVE